MSAGGPSAGQAERFRVAVQRYSGGPPGRIGIALSGGPDSLALLLLAEAAFPGRVEAATVDHGLRAESAGEARFAAAVCAERATPHATLIPASPIGGNLQSSARKARYLLLEGWRVERRLDWILTGHHADDQAETLLMRLNRGAGIGGLASVRPVNGKVMRPLLDWRRTELEAIVAAAGIAAIADPSNKNPRFDRARLREALVGADWIDPAALARSACALAEAEEALEWMAQLLFAERVRNSGACHDLDVEDIPAELRRRLLVRLLRRIDPQAAPRGDDVGRMILALENMRTATLAGVKATGLAAGLVWRLEPAPARASDRARSRGG